MQRTIRWLLLVATIIGIAGCASAPSPAPAGRLRLATTTSTYDSGLLSAILPAFEQEYGAQVDVIAVGTGQALEIGKSGDVDVVLVHYRPLEDSFVAEGFGVERESVMFNDFVLVGPHDDPARVRTARSAAEALARIYEHRSTFVSRADDSGTYGRELTLWELAGLTPSLTDAWYLPIGQGMGETLLFAEEQLAHTLSDRGTYLGLAESLPDLEILFGGSTIAENPDPALMNPYGVIPVTPKDPAAPEAVLARTFVDWLVSLEAQSLIAAFGIDTFGQPLFYPASDAWCAHRGAGSPGCSGF